MLLSTLFVTSFKSIGLQAPSIRILCTQWELGGRVLPYLPEWGEIARPLGVSLDTGVSPERSPALPRSDRCCCSW